MTGAGKTAPRRRPSLRVPLPKTVVGRRRLLTAVVLIGSAAAGYLTTCIAYPRPILRRDHAIARVIGKPINAAEQQLTDLGFKVKVEGEETDPEVPAGHVLWQDPPPDLVVPQGTTVVLTRSSGPAPVPVPDVTDFELEPAIKVILAAGLKVGQVDTVPSAEDKGVVVAVRPQPGSGRPPGTTVDLVVSQGSASSAVPNVVGLKEDEARRQIEAAGFRVGRVSRAAGRRGPPGTVLEQRPAAGSNAQSRARIDLIVSEVN